MWPVTIVAAVTAGFRCPPETLAVKYTMICGQRQSGSVLAPRLELSALDAQDAAESRTWILIRVCVGRCG